MTDITCITQNHFRRVKPSMVTELEGICRAYMDENEPLFAWQLFGVQPSDQYQPHQSLRKLRVKMARLIDALRAEYQPKSRTSSPSDQT